jgi:hypothetical protein
MRRKTLPSDTRHQREKFLVVDRSKEILEVRVDNPFSAGFNFLPNLAQGVFCRSPSSISEVGVIEYRLKDWLQSVEQCLLTYAIIDGRDAEDTPLTGFARLRDALLPYRSWDVLAGAKLFLQSGKAFFDRFTKRLDAFTVNPASPVVGSDAFPRDLQVLPLVDFVDERVNLPRPRRIDPVGESPRSMMFGSFA